MRFEKPLRGLFGKGGLALAVCALALAVGIALPTTAQAIDISLPGDAYGSDRAISSEVQDLEVGEEFTVTAALDVRSIHDTLLQTYSGRMRSDYDPDLGSMVNVNSISSTFYVSITVPATIEVPSLDALSATLHDATYEGSEFVLQPLNVTPNADGTTTITSSMVFTSTDVRNLEQLRLAIYNMGDSDGIITLTMDGFKLKSDVEPDSFHTIVGEVNGDFSATANLWIISYPFTFNWVGVQVPAGADSYEGAPAGAISYTVHAVPTPEPEPEPVTPEPEEKPEPKPAAPRKATSKKLPAAGDSQLSMQAVVAVALAGAVAAGVAIGLSKKDRS